MDVAFDGGFPKIMAFLQLSSKTAQNLEKTCQHKSPLHPDVHQSVLTRNHTNVGPHFHFLIGMALKKRHFKLAGH